MKKNDDVLGWNQRPSGHLLEPEGKEMSKKYDHLTTLPHVNLPKTHKAPLKRTAKKIASGVLIALALLTLIALAVGFSYWISPRGEFPFYL